MDFLFLLIAMASCVFGIVHLITGNFKWGTALLGGSVLACVFLIIVLLVDTEPTTTTTIITTDKFQGQNSSLIFDKPVKIEKTERRFRYTIIRDKTFYKFVGD